MKPFGLHLLCKRPEVLMVPWTFQNLNPFLKWVLILVTGVNSSILFDTTKIGFFLVLYESYIAFMCGGRWLSGGVLDWSSSITGGTAKTLYPLLRTGSIQEDPSWHDCKYKQYIQFLECSWTHDYFGSLAKLKWSPNYFVRDPKCSWLHEHSKIWILFLNECISY